MLHRAFRFDLLPCEGLLLWSVVRLCYNCGLSPDGFWDPLSSGAAQVSTGMPGLLTTESKQLVLIRLPAACLEILYTSNHACLCPLVLQQAEENSKEGNRAVVATRNAEIRCACPGRRCTRHGSPPLPTAPLHHPAHLLLHSKLCLAHAWQQLLYHLYQQTRQVIRTLMVY
jgi:hypothetical protein